MSIHWQCEYFDSRGKRCEAQAVWRLHYAMDHPFDHINCCQKHRVEYHSAYRVEAL